MADGHPVVQDARARSRRTLVQGLVAVAIIAGGEVLCQLLPGVRWTRGWWAVTGMAVGQACDFILNFALSILQVTHDIIKINSMQSSMQ